MTRRDILVVPLGEICDILDSQRKPITKRNRKPGPHPYHGATGVLDHVHDYLFDEELVLVGEDGAKWAAGQSTAYRIFGKTWVNNHAHVLRPNRERVLESWLIYYLTFTDITEFTTGLTVPKLNQSNLRRIPIPLPDTAEQKRIVAFLDEAFAGIETAIANAEKNLANARELFNSYVTLLYQKQCSDSPMLRLSEVCENLDSKRIPITKSKRKSGDIPYYGASGIVDHVADHIFDEDLLLVSEDGANLLARTYPIAFSISGRSWVNNHAHVLRFENLESQRFVEYYLNSISVEKFVSGMAQPKLNQRSLNSIPVPFPRLELQADLVGKLDDLNRSKDRLAMIYREKLTALAELKQSLLHKAFSGELTADKLEDAVAEAVA